MTFTNATTGKDRVNQMKGSFSKSFPIQNRLHKLTRPVGSGYPTGLKLYAFPHDHLPNEQTIDNFSACCFLLIC